MVNIFSFIGHYAQRSDGITDHTKIVFLWHHHNFPLLFFDDNASSLTEIWGKLEWTHIVGALYLGLIASGASLWLWNLSFNKVGAANTNNFLYLLPIISAVAAAIFFTHEITGWVVAGTLLIFFGLIIANNKQNK